jgi:hypothetical protein
VVSNEARRPPAHHEEDDVPHYLLSVHTGSNQQAPAMTDDDMRRGYESIATLESEMKAADALVFSGRLAQPDSARVVTNARGQISTTDGPYVEAKEYLGGFYIIQAADLERAQEWAAKTSEAISMPIEVWPFEAFQAVEPVAE